MTCLFSVRAYVSCRKLAPNTQGRPASAHPYAYVLAREASLRLNRGNGFHSAVQTWVHHARGFIMHVGS